MRKLILSLFFILSLLLSPMYAIAQRTPAPLPESTVEAPNVGEPGPSLQNGGNSLTTSAYISIVMQNANKTWAHAFQTWGYSYLPPALVLLESGSYARSSCGINAGNPREDPALSPSFYCLFGGEIGGQISDSSGIFETRMAYSPVIYLSLPWLEEHVAGNATSPDVAIAYVVSYAVSLHVQYLLGYVNRTGGGCCDYPDLQVHLAAECLTGVWAFSAYDQGSLDQTDVDSAQQTIWGDVATQLREFGLNSDHGTQEQRMESFLSGYQSGDPAACFQTMQGG